MGIEVLIGGLFLVTLLAAIGFAVWNKKQTEDLLEKGKPEEPSALARETPDPNFQPDEKATDPHRVA